MLQYNSYLLPQESEFVLIINIHVINLMFGVTYLWLHTIVVT